MRDVMHSQIEPEDKILLLKLLSVEEFREIDEWLAGVHVISGMGETGFVIVLLSDVEMVGTEGFGLEKGWRVDDGGVDGCTNTREDTVTGGFTVRVLGIGVKDAVDVGAVSSPINLSFIFGLEDGTFEGHGIARSRGPRIFDGLGNDGGGFESVGGTLNIEIGLEGEDVVVHRAGKMGHDFITIILVVSVVSSLDVTRGADLDFDGTVKHEDIVEEVVVVADGGDGTDNELNVLGDRGVLAGSVARDGETSILLEHTDGVGIGSGVTILVESGVEERGGIRTIVTLHELVDIRTKTVVAVKEGSTRGLRISTGVVSNSLLKAEFVEDSLAVIGNIPKSDADVAGETNVKGPSHPLNIAGILINLPTLLLLNSNRRVQVIEFKLLALLAGPSPVAINNLGELLKAGLLPRRAKLGDRVGGVVVDVVVEDTKKLPVCGNTAGDIELHVKTLGKEGDRGVVRMLSRDAPLDPLDDAAVFLLERVNSLDGGG